MHKEMQSAHSMAFWSESTWNNMEMKKYINTHKHRMSESSQKDKYIVKLSF